MAHLPPSALLPKLPPKMPLADVHQHLDAAISMELLSRFAKSKKHPLPDSFRNGRYVVNSDDPTKFLEQFFKDYDDLNDLYIKGAKEYKALVKDYLMRMYRDGVIYTDIMVSAAHAEISGMRFEEMLKALTEAIDEVRLETKDGILATVSLTAINAPSFIPRKANPEDQKKGITSTTKRYGPAEAKAFMEEYRDIKARNPYASKYVTSLGIAAAEGLYLDEKGIPIDTSKMNAEEIAKLNQFRPFKEAFQMALDMGLTLRGHAGEGKGVKSVWDLIAAFKELGVEDGFVIDHGIEIANDPKLLEYVKAHDIRLTHAPSSNMVLNSYDQGNPSKTDLSGYPRFAMQDAGLPANRVGLGGDDNIFFIPESNGGVKYNYQLMLDAEQKRAKQCGKAFNPMQLLEYTKGAADMPFVTPEIQSILTTKIAAYEKQMSRASGEVGEGRGQSCG